MADAFENRGTLTRAGAISSLAMQVDDIGAQLQSPRYQYLAQRGLVFGFSVAAVTVPVVANNMVSVFGLYNPPGSNKMVEVIDVEAHAVLAATVVNALGVYASTVAQSAAATFTTRSNAIIPARLNEGIVAAVQAYSAVTHSGTPYLAGIVGGWGAVTDGGSTPIRKEFNGSLMIPPGTLASLAMTTAASTASGITMGLRWAEVPYNPM